MYPYHRPGQNRPAPPLPQSHRHAPAYPQTTRPPPTQNYPQQTFHEPSFDDDEWSDCSDDGQIDLPYSSAAGYNRPGYQPEVRSPWDNTPPPIPNNRQMPMPMSGSRPPQLPSKNDMDDVYLPIDTEFENSEVGKGVPNKPPPLPPNSYMHGQQNQRPPMKVPPRPPKQGFDLQPGYDQQQDVYEQEDRPQRQPPQPPVPSPRPSPTSSIKQSQLDRHFQKSRDSGYGEPFSRNNSGKTHTPIRVGSNESWSSGDADHEPPPSRPSPNRHDGLALMNQSKFKKHSISNTLPPMPPIKPQPESRQKEDPASNTVKELSQMLSRMKPTSPTPPPSANFNHPPSPRKSFDQGARFPPNKILPTMPPHESQPPNQTNDKPPSPFGPPGRSRKMVEDQPWYANVSRERAELMLSQSGREGSFLVRLGRGEDNPYTITACGRASCYNLRIRKREDQLYALGTKKSNERSFPSVCDLIEYHKTSPVTLAKGEGSVTLTGPP